MRKRKKIEMTNNGSEMWGYDKRYYIKLSFSSLSNLKHDKSLKCSDTDSKLCPKFNHLLNKIDGLNNY